ncbi:hypothetical protein AVEN_205210-1 [Araneus ventricosus]|uniref:F-box domain-containing protein n=1 Tax=Araneus ventricosus TaxID=182803 RepID=A0A4Y2T2E2_ARAVE|nr:hypothetical protein AVEN_205210-1 [Araneus ventricosus]
MVARQSTAIHTVKNCQTLALSKLILRYLKEVTDIEDFRGLTSIDWVFMKRLYPDLQVELILTTYSATSREFEFFILPSMPISSLEYSTVDFNPGTETAALFDHLLACKTNEHLVYLKLEMADPTQHLFSNFFPFLQACKKLKCLKLFMINTTSGIDVLLEPWLENRPESLEKVIIEVSNINYEDDCPSLINITKCVSLLKKAGSKIRVYFDA